MPQETLDQPYLNLKKWLMGSIFSTMLVISSGLGFYTLYLYSLKSQAFVDVEKRLDQLALSFLTVQQQLEQTQKEKAYTEQNMTLMIDRLARYQDQMIGIQTELVNMRRDVSDIQKMPQIELFHRLETLNLLSTEVSIGYARQQVTLHRAFQSAIDQLQSARLRLSYALAQYPALEQSLEEGVLALQDMQTRDSQAHMVERLEQLKTMVQSLPFKKSIQPYIDRYTEHSISDTVMADLKWKDFFYQMKEKMKNIFILRKGQHLDLTSVTPEGQAIFMGQARGLLDQTIEAYHLGDEVIFERNLNALQKLVQTYLALNCLDVVHFLEEIGSLKSAMVKIDSRIFDAMINTQKEALKKQESSVKIFVNPVVEKSLTIDQAR